ncbi:hypothetical protein [Deminuibacter soli]|uniref:Uncharacterized protein n=1 Tax=Deminuibacter soli TaxID=2291815 RepID=A0A3E1NGI8_9BACT|nr:hypothetical protein [Deminuibacter soli]RFM26992.1 hypothetical protein DXN05_16045 [Deminuibacter soli]
MANEFFPVGIAFVNNEQNYFATQQYRHLIATLAESNKLQINWELLQDRLEVNGWKTYPVGPPALLHGRCWRIGAFKTGAQNVVITISRLAPLYCIYKNLRLSGYKYGDLRNVSINDLNDPVIMETGRAIEIFFPSYEPIEQMIALKEIENIAFEDYGKLNDNFYSDITYKPFLIFNALFSSYFYD